MRMRAPCRLMLMVCASHSKATPFSSSPRTISGKVIVKRSERRLSIDIGFGWRAGTRNTYDARMPPQLRSRLGSIRTRRNGINHYTASESRTACDILPRRPLPVGGKAGPCGVVGRFDGAVALRRHRGQTETLTYANRVCKHRPGMSLLYIFAATEMEARAVRRIPSAAWTRPGEDKRKTGTIGANRIMVFVTGVGPAAARDSVQRVISAIQRRELPRPGVLCVAGICGSLSVRLKEDSIVAYGSCLWGDQAQGEGRSKIECSPELPKPMINALAARGIPCEMVTGITLPRLAARHGEKLRLARYGAHVVDMESYEILAAARDAGIPCAVLRIISDSLDHELPDFTPAMRATGETRTLGAAWIALRAPLSTMRMIAAQHRALTRLSQALGVLLGSDCFEPKE